MKPLERSDMLRVARWTVIGAAVIAFFVTGWLPQVALATFPGKNGKITYVVHPSDNTADLEIYTMAADGSAQTRLTHDGFLDDGGSSWSPDGERLAYARCMPGLDASGHKQCVNVEIYVINADGTGATQLTNDSATDLAPSWSPDGERIAFVSNRGGTYEVYVMSSNGSGQIRLTSGCDCNGSDRNGTPVTPSWSPDGERIAFDSFREGSWDVYTMNADGSAVTRLTNDAAKDIAPNWSPDGDKIAFQSNRSGTDEIYTMNADGSSQARLTAESADERGPMWSPDQTKIAFESNRSGTTEIYTMNADGSAPARMTTSDLFGAFIQTWQTLPIAPTISDLHVNHARIDLDALRSRVTAATKLKLSFKFKLSKIATIKVRLYRRQGRKNVSVGSFTRDGASGANKLVLPTKSAKKLRRVASYEATLQATDLLGKKSKRKSVSFKVVGK